MNMKTEYLGSLSSVLYIVTITSIPSYSSGLTLLGADKVTVADHNYKVVCYFGAWAYYRPGDGKFDVSDIDPSLCTHVIFAFAGLDNKTNTMKSLDPNFELKEESYQKDGYGRLVNLKQQNPHLKVLIAIGGWNEGSKKYSNMSRTKDTRSTFIESAVRFLKTYGFDGLDIDWEFPADRGGISEDKENYIALLKELRSALSSRGYLLTVAVSAAKEKIDKGYDVSSISRYVDFINLMCYDYHGAWDKTTGFNAPLYASKDDKGNKYFNVNYTVNYWIQQGAPANKLVLGIPLYGRTFLLDSPDVNKPNSPASGEGPKGPLTNEPNFMGYNEICLLIEETGFSVKEDKDQKVSYAFRNSTWISYDDVESIASKADFIAKMGLGGGMVWSVETDDFLGKCGQGKFPLLQTLNLALASKPSLVHPAHDTSSSLQNPLSVVLVIALFSHLSVGCRN